MASACFIMSDDPHIAGEKTISHDGWLSSTGFDFLPMFRGTFSTYVIG